MFAVHGPGRSLVVNVVGLVALFHATGATAAEALLEYLPEPTEHQLTCYAALDQPVDFDFNDTPLTEVLKFCGDSAKINVMLNHAACQEAGVNPSIPVYLRLSGMSLRSFLRLILEPQGLTYFLEDELLHVTTNAAADQTFITRVYPASDLARTPSALAELVEAVQVGTGKLRWSNESQAGIVANSQTGALVIRQTYASHDEVLRLLRLMRKAQDLQQPASATEPANTIAE